jgi:hypothetical protein
MRDVGGATLIIPCWRSRLSGPARLVTPGASHKLRGQPVMDEQTAGVLQRFGVGATSSEGERAKVGANQTGQVCAKIQSATHQFGGQQ